MNSHIKEKPVSVRMDTSSILEFLVKQYLEEHPINSERIQEIQAQMNPYYEGIDLDSSNELFMLVYDLCSEYENAAFREGFSVGVQLRREIDS